MCPTCAFGFLQWLVALLIAFFALFTGGTVPS